MVAERTYRLGVGMLSVSVTRSEHYTIDELLTVAQRRNPKRPFLFVSKVLGRHIPVRPPPTERCWTRWPPKSRTGYQGRCW